jgi:hypothetical protein
MKNVRIPTSEHHLKRHYVAAKQLQLTVVGIETVALGGIGQSIRFHYGGTS